jgi:hypothetical protein
MTRASVDAADAPVVETGASVADAAREVLLDDRRVGGEAGGIDDVRPRVGLEYACSVDAPPAVELAWTRGAGAETCVDARELAAKVQATIGRPVVPLASLPSPGSPAPEGVRPLLLEGQVQPLGSGWIAVVDVRTAGPELRREVALEATDCHQFDEALVLVVALLADAALPTAPRLTLPKPRPMASMGLGPDVSLALGMLPGVPVGFGLATEVALPPLWHLAAWAHGWPVSEALNGPSGGQFTAWTLGGGPCFGPTAREARAFFGCVGASGGVVYATGVGLDVRHTSSRPYLQGEFRLGVRMRLAGPLFVRLEIGAGVPVARDSYQFTGANGVSHLLFRTAPIVALGRFAVEFRAP